MLSGEIRTAGRVARWWFTDRDGGVSQPPFAHRNLAAHVGDDPTAVRANRDALATELQLGALSWMAPVHGVALELVDAPVALVPNVDALATAASTRPLATMGADCVPLLMVAGEYVIAAHIGWRGFVDGMTSTILRFLDEHRIDPASSQVVLGPSICGRCYGIPAERADAIRDVSARAILPADDGGTGADLRLGLAEQWGAVGADVLRVGPCTFEDRTYFSHRRDGITGRQAGVIAWV